MWNFLRHLYRRTDGGAAVEFGFVFPFFAIMILGVVEYGTVMFQFMNVSHAAQVGANYAMLGGFNTANIRAEVTNATGIPAGNISVVQSCGCATGSAITAMPCGPPLPVCASGLTAGEYVTVTVSQAYSPVAPGVPSPLTAAVLVRVFQ
jgi:Flp pilus assembly protein TadG